MKTDNEIEIGMADLLLAEGRRVAEREKIPFMLGLKKVIRARIEASATRRKAENLVGREKSSK
jgi:hypothetical protein